TLSRQQQQQPWTSIEDERSSSAPSNSSLPSTSAASTAPLSSLTTVTRSNRSSVFLSSSSSDVFCCSTDPHMFASSQTSMVDYILGVADPIQWHSEASASFLDYLLSESAMNLSCMIVIGANHRIWKGTGTTTRNGWGGSARRRLVFGCLADDKIWSRADASFGYGCTDVGQVLPERPFAETCMLDFDCVYQGSQRSISIVGITKTQTIITSRELAANCVTKALRRLVLISSARQAMSGLAATGGVAAARYLTRKISKAWKSRTS
ncbi:hypothetical protein GW17_00006100, partial [Ensete ventricosum]